MGILFLVEYNKNPYHEYIHCSVCRLRVAFLEDHILSMPDSSRGIFNKVFNVEVPDDERYHQILNGNTVADAYCVQCGKLLGGKLIAVAEPSMYYREGRFVMKLEKLIYWNDDPLLHFNDEQVGGANEQDANDQDVGDNEHNFDEQYHDREADADQVAEGIDNIHLNADILTNY